MQSLEVSKIREKTKKNFETCWLSIINKETFSKDISKCDHRFGNTFTFCTDISYIYVKNLNT
jgi:hypothetical protein